MYNIYMKDEEKLSENIEKLVKIQENLASVWWSFFRGIASGFGFFIGSVIIIAIVIYVLSKINSTPVIGGYINEILNQLEKLRK